MASGRYERRTIRRKGVNDKWFLVDQTIAPDGTVVDEQSRLDPNPYDDPNKGVKTGTYYSNLPLDLDTAAAADLIEAKRIEQQNRTFNTGADFSVRPTGRQGEITQHIPLVKRKHGKYMHRQNPTAEELRTLNQNLREAQARDARNAARRLSTLGQQWSANANSAMIGVVVKDQVRQVRTMLDTMGQRKIDAARQAGDKHAEIQARADLHFARRIIDNSAFQRDLTKRVEQMVAGGKILPNAQDMAEPVKAMVVNSVVRMQDGQPTFSQRAQTGPMGGTNNAQVMRAQEKAERNRDILALINKKARKVEEMKAAGTYSAHYQMEMRDIQAAAEERARHGSRRFGAPQSALPTGPGYAGHESGPFVPNPPRYTGSGQIKSIREIDELISRFDTIARTGRMGTLSAGPDDIAAAKAVVANLRSLRKDQLSRGNSGISRVQSTLPREGVGKKVVNAVNRENAWMADAQALDSGTGVWDQMERSHDPAIQTAMRALGLNKVGATRKQDELQAQQDALEKLLGIDVEVQMAGARNNKVRMRRLYAMGEKDKGTGFTGDAYKEYRQNTISRFLALPVGQKLKGNLSDKDALQMVERVLNYYANMEGFSQQGENIESKSNAPKGGYEQQLKLHERGKKIDSTEHGEPIIDPMHAIIGGHTRGSVGSVVRQSFAMNKAFPGSVEREVKNHTDFGELMLEAERAIGQGNDYAAKLVFAGIDNDLYQGSNLDDEAAEMGERTVSASKAEQEYDRTRIWHREGIRHYRQGTITSRVNQAKMLEAYQVILGSLKGTKGGDVTRTQAQEFENLERQAALDLARGFTHLDPSGTRLGGDVAITAPMLGLNASAYSLPGRKRDEVYGYAWSEKTMGGAFLQDMARHDYMENTRGSQLNREDTMTQMSQFGSIEKGVRYQSEYGSLHPIARGASSTLGLYQNLVNSTRGLIGSDMGQGPMRYQDLADMAERHGDKDWAEQIRKLAERGTVGEEAHNAVPMGRGLSIGEKGAIGHFLPFNPLFAAFQPFIDGANKDATGGPLGSWARGAKSSAGYRYYKSVMASAMPDEAGLSATDFMDLLRQRAGIREIDGQMIGPGGVALEGELSGEDASKLLMHAFGPELEDWVHESGVQNFTAADLAGRLVNSGALAQVAGGRLTSSRLADVGGATATRFRLFDEAYDADVHRGDHIVGKLAEMRGDLFRRGKTESGRGYRKDFVIPDFIKGKNPKSRGYRMSKGYGDTILGLRDKFGLWSDRQEAELQATYGKGGNASERKNKAMEIQKRLQHFNQGVNSIQEWMGITNDNDLRPNEKSEIMYQRGLLDSAFLDPGQDKWAILGKRKENLATFVRKDASKVVPQLWDFLTGKGGIPGAPDLGAAGANSPGARQLMMSAVMNAVFETLASQANGVELPGENKKGRMHLIDMSMKDLRRRFKAGQQDITMTRGMMWGENTWTARNSSGVNRGTGLFSIQTTDDAQAFEKHMLKAIEEYNTGNFVGFSAGTLRGLSDVLGLNWDEQTMGAGKGVDFDNAHLPRNILAGKHDAEIVGAIDDLQFSDFNHLAWGGASHPHAGDKGTRDKLVRYDDLSDGKLNTKLKAFTAAQIGGMHDKYFNVNNPDSMLAGLLSATDERGNSYAGFQKFIGKSTNEMLRAMNRGGKKQKAGQTFPGFALALAGGAVGALAMHHFGVGLDTVKDFLSSAGTMGMAGIGAMLGMVRRTANGFPVPNYGDLTKAQDMEYTRSGMYRPEGVDMGLGEFGPARPKASHGNANQYRTPKGLKGAGRFHKVMGSTGDFFGGVAATEETTSTGYTYDTTGIAEVEALIGQNRYTIGNPERHGELPLMDVALKDLIATQKDIFFPAAHQYALDAGRQSVDEKGSFKGAPIAVAHDGKYYLLGGHHRAVGAMIRGDETMPIRVIGGEDTRALFGPSDREFQQSAAIQMAKQMQRDRLQHNLMMTGLGNASSNFRALGSRTPASPPSGGAGRGGGGGAPPPPPPGANPSANDPFHEDHPETISTHNRMMNEFRRFTRNGEDFWGTNYSALTGADYDPVLGTYNGYNPNAAQARFIGRRVKKGAAPGVVIGPPGAGKTATEVARVMQAIRGGTAIKDAPAIVSFANISVGVTDKQLKKQMTDDEHAEYLASGGLSTIHGMGVNVLNELGWDTVFGRSGEIDAGRNFSSRQSRDISINKTLAQYRQAAAKGPQHIEDLGGGDMAIAQGQRFDAYEQLSDSHLIEVFRQAISEVSEDHGQLLEGLGISHQIPRYVDDSGKKVIRSGKYQISNADGSVTELRDRDRPIQALIAEMSKDGAEKKLWDAVNHLALEGVRPTAAMDFFDPSKSQFSPEHKENAKFMYLASHVLDRIDEINQRGAIGRVFSRDDDKIGSNKPVTGLIRNYAAWDMINKPLQYLEDHLVADADGKMGLSPHTKNALEKLYGREFILSEAQDANYSELRLLRLLAGDDSRLTLSGDPLQDLYQWRGGDRSMFMEAAKKAKTAGSYIFQKETYRSTAGMVDAISKMRKALQFKDRSGSISPLVGELPISAAAPGKRDAHDAIPVAIRVQGYGQRGSYNSKEWETEVMGQAFRTMMGMGLETGHLTDPDQIHDLARAVAATGAQDEGMKPEHGMFIVSSNKEVAQTVHQLNAMKVPTMARFAKDKVKNWQSLLDATAKHGIDTDWLQSLADHADYGEFHTHANADKFLTLMRAGKTGIGRYADDQGGTKGLENLIDDVLEAKLALSLPHNGLVPDGQGGMTKVGDKGFASVGTDFSVKGDEANLAFMLHATEEKKNRIMGSKTADVARENFATQFASFTRGVRTILSMFDTPRTDEYGNPINERKVGNKPNAIFEMVEELQQTGDISERVLFGDRQPGGGPSAPAPISHFRPPAAAGGGSSTPPPTGGRGPRGPVSRIRDPRTILPSFADGGYADGGQVVVGDSPHGPEMLIGKNGKAFLADKPTIIDVAEAGGILHVLNADETRQAIAEGKNARKLASAAFGGLFGKKPAQMGATPLTPGTGGLMTFFEDTQEGLAKAAELHDLMKHYAGLDTQLISDGGKGHAVKVNAVNREEREIAKTAQLFWEDQRDVSGRNNRHFAMDQASLDPTHAALAGYHSGQTIDAAMIDSGSKALGFGKDSTEMKHFTDPLEEAGKKVGVFAKSIGKLTDFLDHIRGTKGTDSRGLAMGPQDRPHAMQAFAIDSVFKQPIMESEKLNRTIHGSREQIPGTAREHYDTHAGGMVPRDGESGGGGRGGSGGGRAGGFFSAINNGINNEWKFRRFTDMFEQGEQDASRIYQNAGKQHRAQNVALTNFGFTQGANSPYFGTEMESGRDFINSVHEGSEDQWQGMGVSGAEYAQNAGVYFAAGGIGMTQQMQTQMADVEAKAKAEGKEVGKAVTDWFTSSDFGKETAKTMDDANEIAFAANMYGMDPGEAIRQSRQITNVSGSVGGDSGQVRNTFGMMLKAAAMSPVDPNEFVEGLKFMAPSMAPFMTGQTSSGGEYSTFEALGLDPMKLDKDGTYREKTADEKQQEVHSQAKAAEMMGFLSEATSQGLTSQQAGRAMRSFQQSQYTPNDRQAYAQAQAAGLLGADGKWNGQFTSNATFLGGEMSTMQQGRNLQQMQEQLASQPLAQQALQIEAKQLNIQAQQVAIDTKKMTEMAPVQKASMVAENRMMNMQYAASVRAAEFQMAMQPKERAAFAQKQAMEVRELDRDKRSIAIRRQYEDTMYGAPGQDRSYKAYFASQANDLAQGQSSLNAGQQARAAVNAVGLQAAQTYAGLDQQQTMLTLGQSSLNAGAAYAAQMSYINKQKEFAEIGFEADSKQRKGGRDIEDEAMGDREAMLKTTQEMDKLYFEERMRQEQESYAITLAQGDVVNANNEAFAINMKYFDEETKLKIDANKAMEESLGNQKAMNHQRQVENEHMTKYLEDVIPLMTAYNDALILQKQGYGNFLGTAGADSSGFMDPDEYGRMMFGRDMTQDETNRLGNQLFGDDMTALPASPVMGAWWSRDDDGNFHYENVTKEVMAGGGGMVDNTLAAQNSDPDAQTDLRYQTALQDADAENVDKILGSVKEFVDNMQEARSLMNAGQANASPLSLINDIPGGTLMTSIFGSMLGGKLMGGTMGGSMGGGLLRGGAGMLGGTFGSMGSMMAGGGGLSMGAPLLSMLGPAALAGGLGFGAGYLVDKGLGKLGVDTHGYGKYAGAGAGIGAVVGGPLGALVGAGAGVGIAALIKHRKELMDWAGKALDAVMWPFKKLIELPWGKIMGTAHNALKAIFPPLEFIEQFFTDHKDEIVQIVHAVVDAVVGAFTAVKDFIVDHKDILLRVVGGPFLLAIDLFKAAYDFIASHWDAVQGAVAGPINSFVEKFGGLTDWLGSNWEGVLRAVTDPISFISSHFNDLKDWLGEHLPDVNFDGIVGAVDDLINGIVGGITGAVDWMGKYGGMILDAVDKLINGIVGALKAVVGSALDVIGKIPGSDHIPGVDGLRDWVEGRASGGYATGGLTLVGEQGPELVRLNKGDHVYPAGQTLQMMRDWSPGLDLISGHSRSIGDHYMPGSTGPAISLDPITARNIVDGGRGGSKHVEINVTVESGAQIDEQMIAKLKAELLATVSKALEDE